MGSVVVGVIATPSSLLTRPADTNAYVQNDLIASSTTAGSIVVPSFKASRGPGNSFFIRKARLYTNKTSGMSTAQFLIEFWSAAPTLTNGDNGAYAIATGAANWMGKIQTDVMTQVADGAYCMGVPYTGSEIACDGDACQTLYWTLKEIDATGFTPASSQTFTLVPEIYQN
jgi:hypothetical protein